MHYTRVSQHLAFILGLVLLGASATVGAATDSEGVRTIEVVAKEFAFEPSTIEVKPGQTVRIKLVNQGSLSHNLHIAGNGMETQTLQSGGSDSLTLEAPADGKLQFFCDVPGHKQAGMKGQIVVE